MHAPRLIPLDYSPDTAPRLMRFAQRPGFAFLDSCHGRIDGGRHDIVAYDPVVTLTTRGPDTEIRDGDQVLMSTADPFELVQHHTARWRLPVSTLPFVGGAIGYFAYDLCRRIETLPTLAAQDLDLPDMAIGIYAWAIVVDHERQRSLLVAHPDCKRDFGDVITAWQAQVPVTPAAFGSSFQVTSAVQPEINLTRYANAFRRIQRYIVDGDCYQVNFAQRFSATAEGDPWDAYQRLRNLNPAPFSAYLALRDGAILSSSPERFLKVEHGRVETKPIKGTRPRSVDVELDARMAHELLHSAKDRAENVMIVDLLRNDLGKTCLTGSIRCPELFAIESFATVHHLVSTVHGRVRPECDAIDVLRGCFPGGSITGAPKLRAMEIIEELEPCRRSIYCGSIGYLSFDGTMDTNIAIRTLIHHRGRMYCWAGGGIVMDSRLEDEYQECLDKAAAMLEVFSHAEAQHVGH